MAISGEIYRQPQYPFLLIRSIYFIALIFALTPIGESAVSSAVAQWKFNWDRSMPGTGPNAQKCDWTGNWTPDQNRTGESL